MGLLKRLLGICETRLPADSGCWKIVDNTVEVDLTKAPELELPNSALRLEGPGLDRRVLLLHGQDESFHAYYNKCSHFGGRRFDPALDEKGQGMLRCCSIGQSEYDYEGNVQKGPAPKPIQTFAVAREGDRVVITLE